jgi:hypothetical protein
MARSYAINVSAAVGSNSYPQLAIGHTVASPTVRPKIFEFDFGSHATPADQASEVAITRYTTAAPTGGTTPTIGVLDPGDPSAVAVAYANATGGCTMSTILFMIAVNQRASFRWVAAPGKEFVIPATQYNGAGIQVVAQSASYNVDDTLYWEE